MLKRRPLLHAGLLFFRSHLLPSNRLRMFRRQRLRLSQARHQSLLSLPVDLRSSGLLRCSPVPHACRQTQACTGKSFHYSHSPLAPKHGDYLSPRWKVLGQVAALHVGVAAICGRFGAHGLMQALGGTQVLVQTLRNLCQSQRRTPVSARLDRYLCQ